MAAKTTEYIIHVLVTTATGEQEPLGFMVRTYGHKSSKIKDVTCDAKAQIEKLQGEIL